MAIIHSDMEKKQTPQKCQECLVHIDDKMLEIKEYCLVMINEEVRQAKLHEQSSKETLARFESDEKRISTLSERFDSFIVRFDTHLATREKQLTVMSAKIDSMTAKLDAHISDETLSLKDVHDAIKKISPFVEEATRKKIAEDYIVEQEKRNARIFKARTGWAERILWVVGALLAIAGLYSVIIEIFFKK